MRAERRNAILKARFDARSRANQPQMPDSRAERAAQATHERLLTELEAKRRTLLLYIEQMRAA